MVKRLLFLALLLQSLFSYNQLQAQCACDVGTTTFAIDFSTNPDTSYSLSSTRSGHCCGATGSTQCIKFEVVVHPQTTEIGFQVANPSPPGGAFYQVDCGTPTSLGTPLCVTGLDTFCITFCKSGGDSPTYTISASRSFAVSPDVSIHSNCATDLFVTGLSEPSITWNSVFPGAYGAYNGYLSCVAACDTTTVTPQPGFPPFIDFEVTGTPVGCAVGAAKDTVRVYITPGIIADISPDPAYVCFGSGFATLTANATGGAPPYSYLWSTSDTTQSVAVGAGTYWVAITDTTAGCPPIYDTVDVIAAAGPILANAGPDQTICSTPPSVLLAGSVSQATGGYWSGGAGTYAPNDSTLNATYTPSAGEIAAGSVTLTLITTGNGGCPPDTDQVIITIQTAPVVNAGGDQTICEGDIVSLSGTVTGGAGTGQWSSSGTGTFAPSNTNLNATYTPSAGDISAGTVTLILDATNACAPDADTIVITISPQIVVNAGPDQIICTGDNALLSGSVTGSSTTGSWTTSGTGTFNPNNTTLNATYTPSAADITAGTVTLILTSTNNGACSAVSDTMVITIAAVPVVDAGVDQTICQGDVVNLNGSVTVGSTTGIWTTSGSGTFAPNATTLNATYTPSAADISAGTVTLTLTSTGGCQNISDQMVITILPAPVVNAGPDQTVCANNPVVTLSGAVTVGGTQGVWSTTGSGTFAPNNTTLNATYTPSAGDITAGSVTLILTSTDGCTAISDSMLVTITPAPLVNAGPDISMCANNVVALNGSVTGPTTTGTWTTSGTGTFSPSANALNATYTPSAADTTNGSVTLTLTSTNNGSCNPESDQLTITFTPAPTVNAGNDVTVCANNAVVNLNGQVTGGATTGIWTTSGSGTFAPNTTTLNGTYTPSAADILAGTVTLTLTSTNNGTCLPVSDQMTITITPAPVVNAGADVTVCQNAPNVNLNGSVTGGSTTGQWSTSGTGTFNPNNTTLNGTYLPSAADITAGTVTLILTSTNNGNCLTVSDTMVVTITTSPVVNAGPDVTICNNNIVALNGSVTGFTTTGIWSTSGTGTFSPNNTTLNATYTPSPADTTNGSVVLTLTSTNNQSCTAEFDQLTVTFTSSPNVNAGADIIICANNPVANLNGYVSAPFNAQWTSSGTGTFSPSNTALTGTYTFSAADTAAGGVTLVLESTNNGTCLPVYDTVNITMIQAPIANAGGDLFVCIGDSATLSGTITNGSGTGQWSTNGTGTFFPSSTNLNAVYAPSAGDYTAGSIQIFLASTNNGTCLPHADTITLTFTNPPTVNAGTNLTICANDTAQLNGSVTGTSTTGQWVTLGDGSFIPSDTVLNAQYIPGTNDISNGTVTLILQSTYSCLQSDTVVITVTPSPIVNAGPDQIICIDDNQVILSGTIGGNTTTGIWSTTGTGNFTPSNTTLNATYNLSAADSVSGTFMLILTSTNNGSCPAVSDTVVVTLTTIPVVNAGPDTTFCANNFANLSGTVTGGASTGIWTTSGTGTFSPSSTNLNALYIPSPADIAAGSVTLTLTSTGACVDVSDAVVITITPAPIVFAGNDTTICVSDTLQLNGSVTAGATTGQWNTSGDGTFVPSTTNLNAAYAPGSNDLLNGTVTLILESTNNGNCLIVYDTMVVTILAPPVANAGGDQIVCGGANVNLSGTVTGGTGGFWTTTGTGTFTPNNTNLNATYVPSTGDTAGGSIQIILTSDTANSCGQDYDTITVTFIDQPVVDAGIDFSVCANNDTIFLTGSSSNGFGVWTTTGDGLFIPNDSLLNTTYVPGTQDHINGQVVFELSLLNAQNCPNVTDSLVVTITPAPLVDAGSNISICKNNLLVSLNGSITGGSSTGYWSTNGTGTFIPDSLSLGTNYQPSTADTTNGMIQFILTSTNNGTCNPESDTLIVTFDDAPEIDAGVDMITCAADSVVLTAVLNGGGTTIWTTNGLGTFSPDSASNPVSYIPDFGDTLGPVEFVVTYTNGCGTASDTVLLDVIPDPGLAIDYVVDCETFEVQFNATVNGGTTIQSIGWDFGDSNTDTIVSPLHTYATPGNYTVTIVVTTTDGCTDSIVENVAIEPLPIAAFLVSDSIVPVGTVIFFNDTSQNASSWQWDFGDQSGTFYVEDTTHVYGDTGTFLVTLIVYNNSGCSDTAYKWITVYSDDAITVFPPVVPGAFTPNNDGSNDVLFVRGGPFEEFDLRVYNEWGNELFKSDDAEDGWNGTYKGKEQPGGIYIYLFEGKTINGEEYSLSGDFSLIR